MYVAFFGHRECPDSIYTKLKEIILSLVNQNSKITFLIGDRGMFDSLVLKSVKEICRIYESIEYYIVLAYYKDNNISEPTIYPEEVAKSIPKFAISVRNRWIVEKSDIIITYVRRNWGGAYQSKIQAIKKGKKVIELFSPIG